MSISITIEWYGAITLFVLIVGIMYIYKKTR